MFQLDDAIGEFNQLKGPCSFPEIKPLSNYLIFWPAVAVAVVVVVVGLRAEGGSRPRKPFVGEFLWSGNESEN